MSPKATVTSFYTMTFATFWSPCEARATWKKMTEWSREPWAVAENPLLDSCNNTKHLNALVM